MGWFDEDDNEDQEEERRKPQFLSDFGPPSQGNDITDVPSELPTAAHVGDDDDPLEAYMKSLASSEPLKTVVPPKSSRLDMENEDEATDHWTSSSVPPHGAESPPTGNEETQCNSLAAIFHKASDAEDQHRDHRRIDIQLDKVQHATTDYSSFRKQLLTTTTSTSQGHDWRHLHSISCHPPLDPIYQFAELRDILPLQVFEWIADQEGIAKPTLVQAQLLAVAFSGQDAIATASTGSGKTLAYLLPLVAHLVENNRENGTNSRALVLVPTRELALQVEKVAKSIVQRITSLRALAITGGNMGRYQLSQALLHQKPQLIVATPGRLLDVLSSQQKSKHEWLLREITFLVLDEADKMLQLGFASQVTQILDGLRPDRQSLLTSATWHGRLERHCQQWMHHPTRVSVGRSGISSEHVQQHVMLLPSTQAKESFLKELLPTFCSVGRTIVFCARRDGCEQLAQVLSEAGFTHFQTLHGDKHPSDRQAALKAFTKGTVKLLVATDVAGRGLDIPKVATVVNYDPAKNWDTHVHRIGRAGRLSESSGQQEGSAYTLLTPANSEFAQTLVQAYRREGREISPEIESLANRSSQCSRGHAKKANRNGLGFVDDGSHQYESSHYQPLKKGRWS